MICHLRMFDALLVGLVTLCASATARMNMCYTADHRPQRCLPPFVNAAYGRTVVASNTCGTPPEEYCLQTGVTGVTKSCHMCNNAVRDKRHDVAYLTDLNNEQEGTWWQSQTMLHNVQYPTMVNITLNLTKSFDITYVRLKFHTSRPESFAIYKKSCNDCEWQPFQYYSGSCFSTYGLDNKGIVTVANEQKALCTDDYSDISPLTGGNVAFSTLEGRPSAYNFDRSLVLQDWVKAVAIRITLNRINTFGDEVFRDPKVLKSYYYAISDLSVGGRCSCNGHASACHLNYEDVLTCECQHNTAGPDCEKCAPMFNDKPWSRATREDPGECAECDCNGLSETCYFDPERYRQTGHGGYCTNCRDNTAGPHCEVCKDYYFRDPANNRCTACECSGLGATSSQCDTNGQCLCKPGVGGARCDRCMNGYYGLSEAGCSLCRCSPAGSVEGTVCDSETGTCVCKLNVEGHNCDICKPGFMNLLAEDPYGCTACFCYGHSSVCTVSPDYTAAFISSDFQSDVDNWTGRDSRGNPAPVHYDGSAISMDPENYYMSYFVAPAKFLGEQRFSYNQMLDFNLWLENKGEAFLDVGSGSFDINGVGIAVAGADDLILVGEDENGDDARVQIRITGQGNPLPSTEQQSYRFRLHEAAGFRPRLTPFQFQLLLNTLKSLEIRSTYGEGLVGYLDNVHMTTAEYLGAGPSANWVESCNIHPYTQSFAEECLPGYTRDPPNGGKLARCVPCNCNGHAQTCDKETGICNCDHNTMGDHCELCDDGFYFSGDESKRGTPQECTQCPCPQSSACALLDDGSLVCTSCPPGYAGKQCEMCMDGWFGDPRGFGPCQRCMCNGNIDENAIMNCNRTSGECLKCIHNTTGFHCDQCLPGYYGKPVTNVPEERCRLCECNHLGSRHVTACNPSTGQCECLPNVEGRSCDHCRPGFWNLHSGAGCEACNCHQSGASTGECGQDDGQCECNPGVGGTRCDQCLPNYYSLSRDGCEACNCNPDGSADLQCGEDGRCVCKDGVHGVKCDQCQENYFDIASGCKECPACYGLVQSAVDVHRRELGRLEEIAANIGDQPASDSTSDDDFESQLAELNKTVQMMKERAAQNEGKMAELQEKTDMVEEQLNQIYQKLTMVEYNVEQCNNSVDEARETMDSSKNDTLDIKNLLDHAQKQLDDAMKHLMAAQVIADDSLSKNNNMSTLALEAETIANRHQMESKSVVDTAQEALDTSRKAKAAVDGAVDTLEGLLNTLDNMINSEDKIPATRALLNELTTLAPVLKSKAEKAKNESTDLFTEASKLVVPEVDTDDMNTRSQNIQTEAEALLPEINALDAQYKRDHQQYASQIELARNQLDIVDAMQDSADKLMAQVHSAYLSSQEAVAVGNATYQSVLNNKASLESFDKEITTNRALAEEALAGADAIQAKIDTANNKTQEAREALGSARSVALQARDKAQQAQDISSEIQTAAGNILDEAAASRNRAGNVSEDIDQLASDLDVTEQGLNAAADQANSDKAAVDRATTAAANARKKAKTSEDRVHVVLGQLNDLLDRLNNMADVTDEEITALENELARLRHQVEVANLTAAIKTLEAAALRQNRTLAEYDSRIAELTRDVDNLQEIRDSIPVSCNTVTSVEDEGQ